MPPAWSKARSFALPVSFGFSTRAKSTVLGTLGSPVKVDADEPRFHVRGGGAVGTRDFRAG
jgi:hypothetical protein